MVQSVSSLRAPRGAQPAARSATANFTAMFQNTIDRSLLKASGEPAVSSPDQPRRATPGPLPGLPELSVMSDGDIASFGASLRAALGEAGIDTSTPMKLTVGSDGHVRADSSHPDADRINRFFSENPQLENTFRAATSAASLKAVLAKYEKFRAAYEKAGTNDERARLTDAEIARTSAISAASASFTLSVDGFVNAAADIA